MATEDLLIAEIEAKGLGLQICNSGKLIVVELADKKKRKFSSVSAALAFVRQYTFE